jgi:hypothetical protein
MATKGNKSFIGADGKALKGADALLAVTQSQGSSVNGLIDDDGKTSYGLRISKDGKAEVSDYDRGIKMSFQSLAMGGIRDAGEAIHENTGLGDSNLGTNAAIAVGAIGAATVLNKWGGNPVGKGFGKMRSLTHRLLSNNPSTAPNNAPNTNGTINTAKNADQKIASGDITTPPLSINSGGLFGNVQNQRYYNNKNFAESQGGISKTIGKKMPFGVGMAISGASAVDRFKKGDIVGAGLDMASGVASIFPGIGTVASMGLDAVNIGRDVSNNGGIKQTGKKALGNLALGGVATAGVFMANEILSSSNDNNSQTISSNKSTTANNNKNISSFDSNTTEDNKQGKNLNNETNKNTSNSNHTNNNPQNNDLSNSVNSMNNTPNPMSSNNGLASNSISGNPTIGGMPLIPGIDSSSAMVNASQTDTTNKLIESIVQLTQEIQTGVGGGGILFQYNICIG